MYWQIDQPFRAPEAAIDQHYPNSITQAMWSFPATNRLLFEAGVTILRAEQNNYRMPGVALERHPGHRAVHRRQLQRQGGHSRR